MIKMKKFMEILKQFYYVVYNHLPPRSIGRALKYTYGGNNINSILKNAHEVRSSIQNLRNLKLKPHNDWAKNWDTYRTLSFILKNGNKESKVLDVGCEYYGVILPWLESYEFKNLFGCDIIFKKDFRKGNIKYYKQDLQKTSFPSRFFDFISSISVIEHGVNIDNYLKEMSRLLKKGGFLLTSADYWPEPINTKNLYPYGQKLGEMKIFTKKDIDKLINTAKKYDFELIRPLDFTYQDKVAYWKRVDKRFTYIYFIMKKK